MALFESKAKTTSAKSIGPTVLRTQNVAKELLSIAKSYNTKPEMLDFNILDVQTYTKAEETDTEWEEISNEELYEIDKETQLLNPSFQLKQTYEIEIFSKTKNQGTLFKDMKIAVGANASKCKVYLSIAAGSSVNFDAGLEKCLLIEINKRKIRAGILINIFDEMVQDVVSKISAKVQVAEELKFEKNETYLIAESLEPTATINDALFLHYKKSQNVDENEKIDYASRGFIQSVKKDEVLIEYIKPQEGKPGRNCSGEFMQPEEPKVSNIATFGIDDTIKIEDEEATIKYVATENGYIALENNTYTIKKEVNIEEISFKTTGSISSGVDSDVNIVVSESDTFKDAIGTGMYVEVTEIEIDGNIGSNATIVAKKASVAGQTHKNATITADKLDINIHKGKAFGKNIHVTRLEHGEINGDIVEVTQAIGGNIKGKEVDVELCTSHVKVSATRRIEIKKLQGSENSFTIDPLISKGVKSGLSQNKEEICALEKEIKELKASVKKYKATVKEGMPSFLDIKKRLGNYKKKGVMMPESFVKKYKQFQNIQTKLKEHEERLAIRSDYLLLQTTKTASFQDNIFDARVINRDRWVGYNEIKFKLVDPPVELIYKPEEGSQEKFFSLVDLGEGNYEIQATEEEGLKD